MHLWALTSPELVFPQVPGSDRSTVFRAMAERLADTPLVDSCDELYRRLWEREELGTTAIGSGVAIPHCKLEGLDDVVVAIGLSEEGVDFESEDGAPVSLIFLVISPEDAPAAHLRSLAAISKWVKTNSHVDKILALSDPNEIYELIKQEES